ncbi:hypothetical protein [Mesorhizobium sp. B2-3-4]|uniref:hypothetical protein n=1 Tax=Mesorhizobium sp. B2-3-4 TaxID=2589959 RepID=UPI0011299A89|nr:hypothetical protein [Mesorhizobium sp. B2-3-4]TPM39580.1 hypothetical protein FJ967_08840 [Mesorhizobium sp. B2-3-4]
MALTFPLSLAAFADLLDVTAVKWWLQDNREYSGMGSGQILEADLAPQLWQGDVTLAEAYHYEVRKIEARVNAVIRSLGSFYLYDPRTAAPYADRDGAILGASTVQINSLPDAKSMSLKGLPAGYVLTAGDYLAFDYGSPSRRAFHEVSEDVTAGGGGTTGAFEVSPFIRPGAAVNQTVTLIKPAMKCKIKPGSFSVGSTGNAVTSQISFSVVQKL